MTVRRTICVVTGNRAEYGLLRGLLREIAADPELTLQLVVTGAHLAPEFDRTVRFVEADGFAIAARVEMLLASDTRVGMAKSTGIGVLGLADALARLAPDVTVLLGDRTEALAAATAALLLGIPLAHLHGGEASGVVDDAIRHAITKMAWLHFVAAEPYRRRVIQLGEAPERVWTVGALGLDELARTPLLGRAELAAALGVPLAPVSLLVTHHPVPDEPVEELFEALAAFPDAQVLFTQPNSDAHGRALAERIAAWVRAHPERGRAFTTLGQERYWSAVRHVSAVVGNSSSGLIEAPALGTPTVNIGARQRGRLCASSVVSCAAERAAITAALARALSPEFRASLGHIERPYQGERVAARIKELLKTATLAGASRKEFVDAGAP